MTDTLGNIEIQEIESINVMPMDTPIPYGEVMPGDTSNDAEELNIQPCLGLEFESLEKVREFYNSFAKKNGFGIRIRSSKPKMTVLVCCCEGQHKVKGLVDKDTHDNICQSIRKCSTLRTSCQASPIVSRGDIASNWVIKSFSNDHNHVMLSPKSVCYMRCHKKMSVVAQSLVEKFEEEGLLTGKVASIFNNSDSYFSDRDCWNHIRNLRRKNLDLGDVEVVFNYCKRKQVENPNFFYEIQCDDDSRMVNFLWVDARSRVAYQKFGDVITFDTTYKTNKYNESEKSFTWLFQTWLEAMGGKKSVSIITNQDLTIGVAIKKSTFKRELKRCIRESPCIAIFEEEWKRLMKEYNLEGNEWLQGLYRIKESWIPIFNRSTFFAGMNTTQRSEGINAFFDSFVHSRTRLQEFVVNFEKAVDCRLEAKEREDYKSRHKSRILSTGSKVEHHAEFFYTRNVFGKFQDELRKVNEFTKKKIRRDGPSHVYQTQRLLNVTANFLNLWGYCVDTLVIFQAKGVVQIPDHFVLQCWTKDANKFIEVSDVENNFDGQSTTSRILRRMHAQVKRDI
ncbi:hypothetical protein JHK82_042745 [Glycine max]|uniref:Protein FAR1-RELATED SEQUENCE n=1 Tax=Glycine max TaxID=3847 RepID=A0A0R0G2U3_SOYBN|nr:hypothetical protein JHK82_042745 [Glycine max]KRH12636.1 hypothetical protein GLYMA_15G184200v4 [Glycine max]